MKVHLIGVCGMGMGSLAGLLKQAGHQVWGCDRRLEPPMSERLSEWGIEAVTGFDPGHLERETDLVVVGNVCRADNPEAAEAFRKGLAVKSFPQLLGEMFIDDRHSIVVAGTHGKTTTSALLAWLLERLGREPGYLFGGILQSSGRGFSLGRGEIFVVEGDEYDSAFFDKRPKFLHYRPRTLVLASLEYDHADIYPSEEAYRQAFERLLELLPPQGLVVACRDYPQLVKLAGRSPAPVVFYGLGPGDGYRAEQISHEPGGTSFSVISPGEERRRVRISLAGEHNVANCLAVLAVLKSLGISLSEAAPHLEHFPGVARRLQERGRAAGVTVIDDFAHHPTKVKATVQAARRRYAGQKLVAVFEPRSNTSRRKVFQNQYVQSFDDADEIILVPPFGAEQIPPEERLDTEKLAADLRARGKDARCLPGTDLVLEELSGLQPGAVVLIMSNGSFDGLHGRLLEALRRREDEAR
jgi:UDP-N-acetylmuramate: L-alanyl-gamma-D-glutamyl-meso-diaminopimelate ligase